MVNYCVCGGCTNSSSSGFRTKRKDFTAASVTTSSVICEAHFKKEDYLSGDLMEMEMGFKSRNNILSEDDEALTKEIMNEPDEDFTTDSLPRTIDQALQCNIRLPYRSSDVQVKPTLISIGTQTEEDIHSTTMAINHVTSTPVKNDEEDEQSSFDFDSHQWDSSWSIEEEEMDTDTSEEEAQDEEQRNTKFADKFIVCESQLLSLFAVCPQCSEETQRKVKHQQGTFIKVEQICSACGFEREWQNQPKMHKYMPLCNLMLSGAIHFSGCMPTQALRMLGLLGVQCISVRTFFRHQQLYTIPTIIGTWKNKQAQILNQLKAKEGGLILAGDCRSDSPGHCAKFGTYTVIEERINKVLDLQLVQSSEVPNSNWCELEGLKRTINLLSKEKISVSTLVTDRNRQVAKWVREKLCPEGTKHFFDIWNVSKGLKKALDAASKEQHCEDLALWKAAVINHLYWTAASTPDGNPEVLEAKWTSLVNHVQDIHTHKSPWFPVCAHPPLEGETREKQWLEPGSLVSIKLESMAMRPMFVKDVRQLSPSHQTYSLEAFHALILHFAPKHTGFSFLGMYSRLLLAALHFNHNSNREVLRSDEYAFDLMEHLHRTYSSTPE
uniref:Transposase n=2 Tax=Knipowitschia caucasica TaxID=637954 RepID=A0AAV2KG27_KNICA